MNQRSRLFLNLLLFCCVVTLAAFLVLTSDEQPVTSIKRLTDIDPGSIRNIRIEQHDREPVTFIKQGEHWIMSRPYQIAANDARINAILSLLMAQSYVQLSVKDADLVRYRLDPPLVTLHLDNHIFMFGDIDPLDERRYVLSDNSVHLINDTLYPQLSSASTGFISPRLLADDSKIVALQLPGYSLHLNSGQWSIEPDQDIGSEVLPGLIKAWQQASAITISHYEQQQHHGEISILLENGKQILFHVVSKPPRVILARQDLGIQYHLDSYTAKQLFISGNKTEDKPASVK